MDTPWIVVALFGAVVVTAAAVGMVWDLATRKSPRQPALLRGDTDSEARAKAKGHYYIHIQDSSNM